MGPDFPNVGDGRKTFPNNQRKTAAHKHDWKTALACLWAVDSRLNNLHSKWTNIIQ